MALQLNKTFDNGIVASECYVKIFNANYEPARDASMDDGIFITVCFYYNLAARTADLYENIILTKFYLIADKTKESRSSQYAYLKTLDDFAGATDV